LKSNDWLACSASISRTTSGQSNTTKKPPSFWPSVTLARNTWPCRSTST